MHRLGTYVVRKWGQGGRGKSIDIGTGRARITGLATLPSGDILVSAADPAIGIISRDDRWRELKGISSANMRACTRAEFRVDSEGKHIQFGYTPTSDASYTFDLRSRLLKAGQLIGGEAPVSDVTPPHISSLSSAKFTLTANRRESWQDD